MVPENPTVCYRCRTCKLVFVKMRDINKHLQETNHFVRPPGHQRSNLSRENGEDRTNQSEVNVTPKLSPHENKNGESSTELLSKKGDASVDKDKIDSTKMKGTTETDTSTSVNSGPCDHNQSRSPHKKDSQSQIDMVVVDLTNKGNKKDSNGKEMQKFKPDLVVDGPSVSLVDEKEDSANISPVASTSNSTKNMDNESGDESLSTTESTGSNEPFDQISTDPETQTLKTTDTGSALKHDDVPSASNQSNDSNKEGKKLISKPSANETPKNCQDNSNNKTPNNNTASPLSLPPGNLDKADLYEQLMKPSVIFKGIQMPVKLVSSEKATNGKSAIPLSVTEVMNENESQNENNLLKKGKREQRPMRKPAKVASDATKKNESILKYKCKQCNERFMFPVQVRAHQRIAHGSVITPPVALKDKKGKESNESNKHNAAVAVIKARRSTNESKQCSSSATSSPNNQLYPLRSLFIRARRSSTGVNYAMDSNKKKIQRKPTKFTCKHCSKLFPVLGYLKLHLHNDHPETFKTGIDSQIKKRRKARRFMLTSSKRKVPPRVSSINSKTVAQETEAAYQDSGDGTAETSMEIDLNMTSSLNSTIELGPSQQHGLLGSESINHSEEQTQTPLSSSSAKMRYQPPPKKRGFTCRHCGETFQLLNDLKKHLHQAHPKSVKKPAKSKPPSVIKSPEINKSAFTRNKVRQEVQNATRVLRKKQTNSVNETPPKKVVLKRKSRNQVIKDTLTSTTALPFVEDSSTIRVPNRSASTHTPQEKPCSTTIRSGTSDMKKTKPEYKKIVNMQDEPEPDGFVDTVETILLALTSEKSQTCPHCMKYFRFAGSLRMHLKKCEATYGMGDAEELDMPANNDHDKMSVNDEDESTTEEEESMEIDVSIDDGQAEHSNDNGAASVNNENVGESRESPVPYYKQAEFCKCWECGIVVARFYNLKRHLVQKHKIKMSTNEIHAKLLEILK